MLPLGGMPEPGAVASVLLHAECGAYTIVIGAPYCIHETNALTLGHEWLTRSVLFSGAGRF